MTAKVAVVEKVLKTIQKWNRLNGHFELFIHEAGIHKFNNKEWWVPIYSKPVPKRDDQFMDVLVEIQLELERYKKYPIEIVPAYADEIEFHVRHRIRMTEKQPITKRKKSA